MSLGCLRWPWPAGGGCSGFEMPPAKRRKRDSLTVPGTPADEESEYIGSIPAREVAEYGRRIDEVSQDMEDLNVEEIKNNVLLNHITPLCRPGTPTSDTRSVTSTASSYNRMDDLTAVLTVIVVQALSNVSKLSRMMRI